MLNTGPLGVGKWVQLQLATTWASWNTMSKTVSTPPPYIFNHHDWTAFRHVWRCKAENCACQTWSHWGAEVRHQRGFQVILLYDDKYSDILYLLVAACLTQQARVWLTPKTWRLRWGLWASNPEKKRSRKWSQRWVIMIFKCPCHDPLINWT